MSNWKTTMGKQVAVEASLPGVWKAREPGTWFIRARKKCPKTSKLKEVKTFVEARTAKKAYQILQDKLDKLTDASSSPLPSVVSPGLVGLGVLGNRTFPCSVLRTFRNPCKSNRDFCGVVVSQTPWIPLV